MALIKSYKGITPQIASDVFLAENATLIGDVQIGAESSVWYQAVIRGDVGAIRVGRQSNIQDAAILHCTTGRSPLLIGDRVIVGHRAILHGCFIEDEVLIGMGAIILDEARIPSGTIVAAGALVTERSQLESGHLYAGIPARKIKKLQTTQLDQIRIGALHYVENRKFH